MDDGGGPSSAVQPEAGPPPAAAAPPPEVAAGGSAPALAPAAAAAADAEGDDGAIDVDPAEVHLLLVLALADGPFAELGEALAAAAGARGLLPRRPAPAGGADLPLGLAELRARAAHVPRDAVARALGALLARARRAAPGAAARGLTSLLDPAVVAALPALRGGAPPPRPPPRAARPPAWARAPAALRFGGAGPPPPRALALRESGAGAAAWPAAAPAAAAAAVRHHLTARGHRLSAYCVALDPGGGLAVTGADDRLVKIWSLATGLLVASCHGHAGEVSDLAVSCDGALAASASLDGTVRVWRLRRRGSEPPGTPVSVLAGHEGAVTSVAFHPAAPEVVVSAGADGTCRVWRAADVAAPPLVLRPEGRAFAGGAPAAAAARATRAADARQQQQEQHLLSGGGGAGGSDAEGEDGEGEGRRQLVACAWTRDGAHIAAGSDDRCVYVWRAPPLEAVAAAAAAAAPVAVDGGAAAAAPAAEGGAAPAAPPPAPPPAPWGAGAEELCRLEGHSAVVYLLQLSRRGDLLASASRDGTVRLWRRAGARALARRGAPAWAPAAVLACPPLAEDAAGAARRARPPPGGALRVDQVAWAADDATLAASCGDFSVRVFDAATGALRHVLRGHTDGVHVLLAHPHLPGLLLSASYDGTAVFWDTARGAALRALDSRDTRPGEGRAWPDALPFVDGAYSADGSRFALTDAAGQLHVFGAGPPCALARRAPYDQFLPADFYEDDAAAAAAAPPLGAPGAPLVDIVGTPYPEAFQAALSACALLRACDADAATAPPGVDAHRQLDASAPTLVAAWWRVMANGGREGPAMAAAAAAQARLEAHDAAVAAGRPPPGAAVAAAAAAAARAHAPSDGEESSDGEGGRRRRGGPPARASQRLARRHPGDGGEGDAEGAAAGVDAEALRERQRADRESRARRRQDAHEAALATAAARRARRRGSAGGRTAGEYARMLAADSDGGEDFYVPRSSEDEEGGSDVSLEEEGGSGSEGGGGGDGAGPSRPRRERRPSRRAARRRRRSPDARGGGGGGEARERKRARRPPPTAAGRARARYAWLAAAGAPPGRAYVPQVGDAVIYFREGHAAALAAGGGGVNGAPPPPWAAPDFDPARAPRAAEPALVERLEYVVAAAGAEWTLARAALRLTDPASPAAGAAFVADVPPPAAGLPDFLAPAPRFAAALAQRAAVGDAVAAYFLRADAGGEEDGDDGDADAGAGAGAAAGGEWWVGRVAADARAGGWAGVAEDPLGCGGLWDRLTVEWEGVAAPGGVRPLAPGEPGSAPTVHPPWELHPRAVALGNGAAAAAEAPALEDGAAARAAAAVDAALGEERWAVFAAAPEADEAYRRDGAARREFYNRRVALPLALLDLQRRLERGHYRSVAALEADAALIAANAAAFNGVGSDIAVDAAALARFLVAATRGEAAAPAAFVAEADAGVARREAEAEAVEAVAEAAAAAAASESDAGAREEDEEAEASGDDEDRWGRRRARRRAARAPREPRGGRGAPVEPHGGRYASSLRAPGRRVVYDAGPPSSADEEEARAPPAPQQQAYATRRAGGQRLVIRLRAPVPTP
jgi:WD40 repeat protein